MTCPIYDLGHLNYASALEIQRNLRAEQIEGNRSPTLLLVEHPPTITIGRRGSSDEVVAPPAVLKARGVEVHETDRGGQVTYHGPGQLVAYPLINVEKIGLHEYLRRMEEAIIETIAVWGLEGYRVEGRTGVWIGKEKICAMGVHVRKWWTNHGLALNVTTNLNHFGLIIPCGIRDRGVCSLESLLKEKSPSMTAVKEVFCDKFSQQFELDFKLEEIDFPIPENISS